jgi:hypothetical protein
MDMLSTPFDGHDISPAVAGTWSAANSGPPVPSLPLSSVADAAGSSMELTTPWDATGLSAPTFSAVSELPTL